MEKDRDRHVESRHTKKRFLTPCGKSLSRYDSVQRHIKRCTEDPCVAAKSRAVDGKGDNIASG
jgi:hypothetical protein